MKAQPKIWQRQSDFSDAKVREALPAALAATLGNPLLVVAVVRSKSTKRLDLNPTLAPFTVDGHLLPQQAPEAEVQITATLWAHDLNGSGAAVAVHARVRTVLSIVATHVALPGPNDLEVMQ